MTTHKITRTADIKKLFGFKYYMGRGSSTMGAVLHTIESVEIQEADPGKSFKTAKNRWRFRMIYNGKAICFNRPSKWEDVSFRLGRLVRHEFNGVCPKCHGADHKCETCLGTGLELPSWRKINNLNS